MIKGFDLLATMVTVLCMTFQLMEIMWNMYQLNLTCNKKFPFNVMDDGTFQKIQIKHNL